METEWLFHSLFPKASFESWNTGAQRSARACHWECRNAVLAQHLQVLPAPPFLLGQFRCCNSGCPCHTQEYQPEGLGSQVRLSHVCISSSLSKSIPETKCSSPAGRAGLDTRSPSYRVELPCHPAPLLKDWHLQICPLFSVKISLGCFQDLKFSGHKSSTYIDTTTISVWETYNGSSC